MPELPEVETIVSALRNELLESTVTNIEFYRNDLREVFPKEELREILCNSPITDVQRRGKYILIKTRRGAAIIHLGMTGSLRFLSQQKPNLLHTHVIFTYRKKQDQGYMHFVDPRRFGRLSCSKHENLKNHPFLKNLGTEPLEENNLGQYLYKKSHTRSIGIKPFLMDSKVVVGVGNIYATEVLFKIGIHPETTCSKITLSDYKKIGRAIQSILNESIKQGGTTLSDFYNSDGSPGLFKRELKVYGKENEPCKYCSHLIQRIVQSQRSSWFCPVCQKLKI